MTDVTTLLAPVKARAEKATEGPWEAKPTRATEWMPYYEVRSSGKGSVTPAAVDWEGFGHGANEADAAFIAAARTDVPRLVAAIEAVAGLHYEGVAYADDIPEGGNDDVPKDYERHYCNEDGHDWPCPTITAVVAALGGGE